ncbi:MAG: hypothetical protein ACREA0_25620, partial [bacterium]
EFEAAEKLAKRLRMTRSELYRKALGEFLARHAATRVTDKLNEVYAEEPTSTLDEGLRWMQAKSIPM